MIDAVIVMGVWILHMYIYRDMAVLMYMQEVHLQSSAVVGTIYPLSKLSYRN